MSTDLEQYTPLKTIVSYFIDEADKSLGDFDKCWVLGFRALADLGFDISFEPETFRLPINGNMTATLPEGYIKWTKIGVINASDEVSVLKINTALTKWRDNNPNRLTAISPNISDTNQFFYNYYFGSIYSPYFGIGNGLITHGDCVVDEKNKLIVFQPGYAYSDVLVECIVSPQSNGDYQIQTVCQEAVIAFIAWKMKIGSEQDYYNRKIEARRRLKPVTLGEINQAIRENQKYSLKG
jgi:hypothetical protein